MIVKQEPLLKDEEEKIVFRNTNNNNKKNNFNFSVVLTVILTAFVFYAFGDTMYKFYLGFKYYDLRLENKESLVDNEDIKEEEIPLNSALLASVYNKINLDNCSNDISLLKRFYSYSLNNIELTQEEKITLIFNKIIGDECINNLIVPVDEFNSVAFDIFNVLDFASLHNMLQIVNINYNNLNVTYDNTQNAFVVNQSMCNTCDDNFVAKKIVKATTKGDELYIYEKYGYFLFVQDNSYNIYGDFMHEQLLGNYTDLTGNKEYTDYDNLKTYKWTYKKGTDDNYYFVSVIQI